MKLYATTTSERASKGQGGNDYIAIKLRVGENREQFCNLYLSTSKDGSCYELINKDNNDVIWTKTIKGKKPKML